MGQTRIEWATHVWNPVSGCYPVSEGCQNCYARRMANRLRGRFGYPEDEPFRVTLHPERLGEPLRWQEPRRVFVCSMGDLFHEDVPDEFIKQVFDAMATDILQPCKHTYMVLTKRPERMLKFFERYTPQGTLPWPNVWLGVTAENQARADERIPILLQIPASVRFVSCEPLLGPVDLSQWLEEARFCERHGQLCEEGVTWENGQLVCRYCKRPVERLRLLHWVIAGGETGPNARPMHPDWVRSLRDQCQAAGVSFFFKAWGEYLPCDQEQASAFLGGTEEPIFSRNPKDYSLKVGKKASGRLLDGRTWDEYPEVDMRGPGPQIPRCEVESG